MNQGKTVFNQLMSYLPIKSFNRCVNKYRGHHKVKSFSCLDQFYCMAFAQLTYRESLRDIEACLRSRENQLFHMGFRSRIARNTLAHANEKRDWRIYAEFAQTLIHIARDLYVDEPFGLELEETVYALDSTTIDLCLSLFPWAHFRRTKAAIKLHTLLNLRGNIPDFIEITDGKVHDVNILDVLIPEPGSVYLMDRAYIDYHRLYLFHLYGAFFVVRAKRNFTFRRLSSHAVDKSTGLRCDQTVVLRNRNVSKEYPDKLRRVKFYDQKNDKTLVFLSNIFTLPALTISKLFKCRWRIEIFFKWIKQNLRIKSFYGTSPNAVKTQIWISISTYVLIAIVKKRLDIKMSLYTFLQILSVNMFEKVDILQLVANIDYKKFESKSCNQLYLFD